MFYLCVSLSLYPLLSCTITIASLSSYGLIYGIAYYRDIYCSNYCLLLQSTAIIILLSVFIITTPPTQSNPSSPFFPTPFAFHSRSSIVCLCYGFARGKQLKRNAQQIIRNFARFLFIERVRGRRHNSYFRHMKFVWRIAHRRRLLFYDHTITHTLSPSKRNMTI